MRIDRGWNGKEELVNWRKCEGFGDGHGDGKGKAEGVLKKKIR